MARACHACLTVGGDIDSTVLAKARHARYTEFSFRGVPASVRSRYFDKDCQTYVLKPEVKKLVHFHELNLLADNQPTVLQDFDIIFSAMCRFISIRQHAKRSSKILSS